MQFLQSVCKLLLSFILCSASASWAQTATEFYAGKTIELDIGFSVGGAYDAYARMLAHHLAKYIPGNPAIVPKNVEGAGSLRLANYLYNAAPRDGTAIGTISRSTGYEPLFGNAVAQFDATKFNWIGSTNSEVAVCVSWHTSGVETFADARVHQVVMGASGPSADSYQVPKIANAVLGTKFKIVTGYPGGNDIDLAIERGELQGRCGWSWTSLKALHPGWLAEHKLNLLFQAGLRKSPDLPDVPLVLDLAATDEGRAILKLILARQTMAWPYLAPPGVPADRVELLRTAFMGTLRDGEFLAEARKANLEITPVAGADIQDLVRGIYATPAAIASKTAALLQ